MISDAQESVDPCRLCQVGVCSMHQSLWDEGIKEVSEEDTRIIQKFICAGYRRDCPSLTQGICRTCQPDLVRLKQSEEGKDSSGEPKEYEGNRVKSLPVKSLLPDNYHYTLPNNTRSQANVLYVLVV